MSDQQQVRDTLYDYIVRELMEGESDDLDDTSPLLAWGVLNSLEIVRLREFIERTLHVEITDEDANPDNFATLGALTALVLRLSEKTERRTKLVSDRRRATGPFSVEE